MDRRCILAVFAHPDDETTAAGAALTSSVQQCVEVHVITATRGELGTLGTSGLSISRESLPHVREAELRSVLQLYGAHPPHLLGYLDQRLQDTDLEEVVGKVKGVMDQVRPDIVVTFGPLGISRHPDHIAIHRATIEAFHRYRMTARPEPRLFYVAIPKEVADGFELKLDGPETQPTHFISVDEQWATKVAALRLYRSQEDAQEMAVFFEEATVHQETFHQAYPPVPAGHFYDDLWQEPS